LRRVFLDEGEPMSALLQAVIPTLKKRALAVYAAELLRELTPKRTGQGSRESALLPALVEPLSPQEQRVLRLLAAGLSNPEIARELVVSPNTIKTQVKSIFRKLDVGNREEAGAAARKMRIV
jgi:LuxR family maltose regulon positive regulatory protein